MTEQAMPAIIRPDQGDVTRIASLIAEAFRDLPAARWLVPFPDHRHPVLRDQFAILVEHALLYGHVDLLEDHSAVAVWFHRTRRIPPPHDYHQRLQIVCGPYTHHFEKLDELFETYHPSGEHHHLAFLAVTPKRQRQGLGSRLLAHHHAVLNRDGIPAYLEASSISSRDLYLRHGYRSGIPFSLPNGALFWPMWRAPR